FFSSRRRHTRSKRDWSSDVCSSDLIPASSSSKALTWAAAEDAGIERCSAISLILSVFSLRSFNISILTSEERALPIDDNNFPSRSEERRVGKEVKYRGV